MILTTTPQIEGHPIREYKGLVTGETIIGANVIKDIKASIKDFFGGRSGSYERVLIEAKETSLKEMTARAQSMGANAIKHDFKSKNPTTRWSDIIVLK